MDLLNLSLKKAKEWQECLMVVVGWASMWFNWVDCTEKLTFATFVPQLDTMAAALTMLFFVLHVFTTAVALESTSEQGISKNFYLVTVPLSWHEKIRILKTFAGIGQV